MCVQKKLCTEDVKWTSLAGDTIFTAFCVVRDFSTSQIAFQVTPLTILHPPHNSIKLHYYHRHLSVVAFCLSMKHDGIVRGIKNN